MKLQNYTKSTIKAVHIIYILSLLKLCDDFVMTRPKGMPLFNQNNKELLFLPLALLDALIRKVKFVIPDIQVGKE